MLRGVPGPPRWAGTWVRRQAGQAAAQNDCFSKFWVTTDGQGHKRHTFKCFASLGQSEVQRIEH